MSRTISRTTRLRIILTGVMLVMYLSVLAVQAHAQSVNDHAIVTDQRGQPVRTASTGTCVRTRWVQAGDPCRGGLTEVTQQATQVKRTVISQDERTVYFPFNVASLTPDAMGRLNTLANDIKSRNDVHGARVAGFADRIGTVSYNEQLSKKRAEHVKDYLVSKGIVNASVTDTRWFGESLPATNCPTNLPRPQMIECLQKDRRVEVEIDYTQQVVAANENTTTALNTTLPPQ